MLEELKCEEQKASTSVMNDEVPTQGYDYYAEGCICEWPQLMSWCPACSQGPMDNGFFD